MASFFQSGSGGMKVTPLLGLAAGLEIDCLSTPRGRVQRIQSAGTQNNYIWTGKQILVKSNNFTSI